MRWLLRSSVYHPWIIIGTVAVVTVLACLFIPRVQLQLDARSLIPSGDPHLTAGDEAAKQFGLRDVVVLGVVNKDAGIYNPVTLARITRLTQALSGVNGIVPSTVTSVASIPRLSVKQGLIAVHRLPSNPKEIDLASADDLRSDIETMGLNDGVLVASDGRAAAIFSEVQPDADRYSLLKQVRELAAREATNDDSIYLGGTALAQAVLGEASAKDLVRLIPLVILVLGAGLMFAFRSPAPAIASLVEICVSLLWTIGLMGLSGQSVFVTTLVLPVILVSVGVSDDVYPLKHYFDALPTGDKSCARDTIVEVFNSLKWPIGLTTISTVVGLGSMATTHLQPLRVFGVFSAVSILISTLFTFTLVPAVLVLLDPRRHAHGKPGTKLSNGTMSAVFRILMAAGPKRVLVIIVIAVIGAALLITRLRVDDSWIQNLPTASDIVQGDSALNKTLAGTTTVDLMIDSGRAAGFLEPQYLLALAAFEEAIAEVPDVGSVRSVCSDILRVNAALRGMSYSEYRTSLRQGQIELRRKDIEQALLLAAFPSRGSMSSQIDDEHRRARLTIFVRSADYVRIKRILDRVNPIGQKLLPANTSITPFGDGWISYLTVQLLVEGQMRSIAVALLIDLLLLSLLLKSVRSGLISLLPVAFSVLLMFAILAVTGIPLGIANSMFAGIAIGIGLDFAIRLTAADRQARASGLSAKDSSRDVFMSTAPAIVISAGAIAAGFSVLLFSQITPNVQLGLMTCLSLTISAVVTLILAPSLMLVWRLSNSREK